MRFDWSPEQESLFTRTLSFARTRLTEHTSETGEGQSFSREVWELMGRFGILRMITPEDYGGMHLDALTSARVVEALGQGCDDLGLIFAVSAHLFACVSPIIEHGNDSLKERVLQRLSSGEWIGANAMTEAESGSDVSSLRTLATRDGDHYILNGTKSYVTNGPLADVILVYATQNPAHGYLGISAFVVERTTPGLRIGRPMDTVGLRTSTISAVYFEDCRVPVDNRLGASGRGSAIFASSMLMERSCLFAMYVGAMQRMLDTVIEKAGELRLIGRRYQSARHRIVDMKMQLEAARLLLYRACWEIDRGSRATMDVALAKLAVSETMIRSCFEAFELLGVDACMSDNGFERALRDSLAGTIFSGTSEIQRELIARELGL